MTATPSIFPSAPDLTVPVSDASPCAQTVCVVKEKRIAAALAVNLDISLLRIVSILMKVHLVGLKLDFVGIATDSSTIGRRGIVTLLGE